MNDNTSGHENKEDTSASSASRPVPGPPRRIGLRGAFHIRAGKYPWNKAIVASMSMGMPVLLGIVLGHPAWGLLGSMGGLTSLYTHNEPYAQRAVKLMVVALGLAFSFGIGSLCAATTWGIAFSLGLVSFAATLMAGAYRVPPPSGYMFVLACSVGTGLPVHPGSALFRSGLALVGGALAWLLAMSGWLFAPHGPETSAVVTAYRQVAAFLAAIGTEQAGAHRHLATLALRGAEDAVTAGELRWRSTPEGNRLFVLAEKATTLFLVGIDLAEEAVGPLDPAFPAFVRALADVVKDPDRAASLTVPMPGQSTPASERLYRELTDIVQFEKGAAWLQADVYPERRGFVAVVKSTFNWRSLVLAAAIRMTITVVAATFIARALGNTRPYWVPLTCAAVLQGTTVMGTMQRTMQRALGTAIGVLVGGAVLSIHPSPWGFVLFIMIFQLVVELIIVRNYGLAVVFITPLPFLLAESGQPALSPWVLVSARLLDTLLGCALGVVSIVLLWRRQSSFGLLHVLEQTMRAEAKLFHDLREVFRSGNGSNRLRYERRMMFTALINLKGVYDSAMADSPRKNVLLDSIWPAVVAVQRIGYVAAAAYERHGRAGHETDLGVIPSADGGNGLTVDAVLSTFADDLGHGRRPTVTELPELAGYPTLQVELKALRDALQHRGIEVNVGKNVNEGRKI